MNKAKAQARTKIKREGSSASSATWSRSETPTPADELSLSLHPDTPDHVQHQSVAYNPRWNPILATANPRINAWSPSIPSVRENDEKTEKEKHTIAKTPTPRASISVTRDTTRAIAAKAATCDHVRAFDKAEETVERTSQPHEDLRRARVHKPLARFTKPDPSAYERVLPEKRPVKRISSSSSSSTQEEPLNKAESVTPDKRESNVQPAKPTSGTRTSIHWLFIIIILTACGLGLGGERLFRARPTTTPLPLLQTCAALRLPPSSLDFFSGPNASLAFSHPPTLFTNRSYRLDTHDSLSVIEDAYPSSTLLMSHISNTLGATRLVNSTQTADFGRSWEVLLRYKKELAVVGDSIADALESASGSTHIIHSRNAFLARIANTFGTLRSSFFFSRDPGSSPGLSENNIITEIVLTLKGFGRTEQDLLHQFRENLEATGNSAKAALFLARWYLQWSKNQLIAWKIAQTQSHRLAHVAAAEKALYEIEALEADLNDSLAFVQPYAGSGRSEKIFGFAHYILPEGRAQGSRNDGRDAYRSELEQQCWEKLKAVSGLLRSTDAQGVLRSTPM